MSNLVTKYSAGSGFVGRIPSRGAWPSRAGALRVAVGRRPERGAVFVRPYGVVGQVEPGCSPTSATTTAVRAAIHGADVVGINWASAPCPSDRQEQVQPGAEPRRRARSRASPKRERDGPRAIVHVSAIGADPKRRQPFTPTARAMAKRPFLAAFPIRGDLAPLDRVRARGPFFNPLRRDDAHGARAGRRRGPPRWRRDPPRFQPVLCR